MSISDQLSNYDDISPTNDKILGSQLNISTQSPSMAVPVQVKENILKVHIPGTSVMYTKLFCNDAF